MSSYEVSEPIQNSPFEKPKKYWYIQEGEEPELRDGRRVSVVFPPRDQKEPWSLDEKILQPSKEYPSGYDLALVNLIRERVEAWRQQGYPGVTRTTLELILWWTREGRDNRLRADRIRFNDHLPERSPRRLSPRHQRAARGAERRSQGRRLHRLSALRVQDGDGIGKDHGHGNAGGVEHLKQGQRPERCAIFRRSIGCLPQRDHPWPVAGA